MRIAGEGASVSIDVAGYENANADLVSDANWAVATVSAQAGTFSGSTEAALTTGDLAELARGLEELTLRGFGAFAFEAEERQLRFKIEVNTRGQARIHAEIMNRKDPRVELAIEFDSDQTFLRRAADEALALCRSFPETRRIIR